MRILLFIVNTGLAFIKELSDRYRGEIMDDIEQWDENESMTNGRLLWKSLLSF